MDEHGWVTVVCCGAKVWMETDAEVRITKGAEHEQG